ncbi:MAG TPA: energy transducer TonB [Terriglobia bacterium]|nr:energy transducer TonB [Terriglobia bacterium]
MRHLTLCRFNSGLVALPTLVLACALTPAALRAAETKAMEAELNRTYKDQVLILRNFYGGNHRRYDASGQLLERGRTGYWTVDGEVRFDGIKFRRAHIEVAGTRLWLAYDRKSKQFGQVRWPGNNVRIELEADPRALTLPQVQTLMAKVFLTKNEKWADFAPAYWRSFLSGRLGPDGSEQQPLLHVPTPGHNDTPPIALPHEEPPYTEEARKAKLQGTVALWVIVDREGKVSDVQIARPLGLGLDDQAVETVRKWRFKPATRDGVPVQVRVSVETTYRMF